jgi:hypothetical protein
MAKLRRMRFAGCAAVELTTRSLRLIMVVCCGPRIAFFGPRQGENLLYWAPNQHRRGRWYPMGGHRVWTTRPGADESEETYRPDNAACEVSRSGRGFTAMGAVDTQTRIQRGLGVRMLDADRIAVDHSARNAGDMLWSGGLWGVTCIAPKPARIFAIPLGDASAWDFTTITAFHTWAGGRGREGFADPQFSCTRDQYVLRPSGRVNKRLLKADRGIVAMHDVDTDIVFAKHALYERSVASQYPLGANLALYTSPQVVEMETMGPTMTLKPQEMLRHTEIWLVRTAQSRPPTTARLRGWFRSLEPKPPIMKSDRA